LKLQDLRGPLCCARRGWSFVASLRPRLPDSCKLLRSGRRMQILPCLGVV